MEALVIFASRYGGKPPKAELLEKSSEKIFKIFFEFLAWRKKIYLSLHPLSQGGKKKSTEKECFLLLTKLEKSSKSSLNGCCYVAI